MKKRAAIYASLPYFFAIAALFVPAGLLYDYYRLPAIGLAFAWAIVLAYCMWRLGRSWILTIPALFLFVVFVYFIYWLSANCAETSGSCFV
jgi:hypothetical protein